MAEKKGEEITIGRPLEFKTITDEGKFKTVYRVPYTMDGRHYEIEVDKDGSTAETIEAAVRADAKRISDVKDKKITL